MGARAPPPEIWKIGAAQKGPFLQVVYLTKKSRFDEALSLQKQLLELFDTAFCAGDFPEGFRSGISLRGFDFGKGRQPLTEKQSAMLTTATKKIRLIIQQMLDNPVLA